MNSRVKSGDIVLNRVALVMLGIGVVLLVVEIGLSVYSRFYEGGPFVANHHPGADGYRFIAIVGLILANGLVYGTGKAGQLLGWAMTIVILRLLYLWFMAFSEVGADIGARMLTETLIMGAVAMLVVYMFLYIPYRLLLKRNSRNRHHAVAG